jgi:hypothetical protein
LILKHAGTNTKIATKTKIYRQQYHTKLLVYNPHENDRELAKIEYYFELPTINETLLVLRTGGGGVHCLPILIM